ncbi:CAP domain-containing protein [Streptacidiphilus sp. EB129]|uniref:CAP domain-containing protein n=1 Tax=Streptacidiphilus sp. EB129 TaxID=3156262 RepID=UPI0035176827
MNGEFETAEFDAVSSGGGAARHGRGRGRRRSAAHRGGRAAVVGTVGLVTVCGGAFGVMASSGSGSVPSPTVAGAADVATSAQSAGTVAPTGPGDTPGTTSPTSVGSPAATPSPHPKAPVGSATAAGRAKSTPTTGSSTHPSVVPRAGGGQVSGTPATGTAAQFAQQIVDMVNAERAKAGCGPLRVNAKLQTAAQEHSDDMAARDYYEHDTPEGIDPGTRMTNAGYSWQSWGENIYKSPTDPSTAMTGWMNSPAHRDNILDCSYQETGVGVNLSGNGPWWTEDFGRPQ